MKLQLSLFFKTFFRKGFVSWTLIAVLSGCAPQVEDREPGATDYLLPWPNAAHEMTFQNVKIKTITKISKINGSAAKFLISPSDSKNQIHGFAPTARYSVTGDKTVIPTDLQTLQLFTLYAHFERLAEFDKKVGAYTLLKWPRKIGVAANMNSKRGAMENNAMYSASLDAMLFVPYTKKDLSMTINPGIIAHEHFHAIFQKLVVEPLTEAKKYPSVESARAHEGEDSEENFNVAMGFGKSNGRGQRASVTEPQYSPYELYHLTLYRALNEGFADVWAWFYTNNPNFVGNSLVEETRSRSLVFKPQKIPSKAQLMNQMRLAGAVSYIGQAYRLSTAYSRLFKFWTEERVKSTGAGLEATKEDMAKRLLAMLKDLSSIKAKAAADEYVEPDFVITQFASNLVRDTKTDLTANECQLLLSAVSAPEEFTAQFPVCGAQ